MVDATGKVGDGARESKERIKGDRDATVSYVAGILSAMDYETACAFFYQGAYDMRISEWGFDQLRAALTTRDAMRGSILG